MKAQERERESERERKRERERESHWTRENYALYNMSNTCMQVIENSQHNASHFKIVPL